MPRKAKSGGKLKLKTHKATSKRFRLTGTGKVVRTRAAKATCAATHPSAPSLSCLKCTK